MGNESSKGGINKKFERQVSMAMQSSPEEFSDLVVVSSDGKEHHKNKFPMMIAFPGLRKHLLDHNRLDTFLSNEVIENLDEYAVSEVLTLDNYILELVGVLLELVPIESLREKITDDVFSQVKDVLLLQNAHETLTVPALAALVFVAKIHDMAVHSHLRRWMDSQAERYDSVNIFTLLDTYSREAKKEDLENPLSLVSSWMRKKTPEKKLLKGFGKSEERSRFFFLNED